MDDRRVGSVFRALRHRRGWRQRDVAERAGVSQQLVSLMELGRFGEVDLETARRVAATLDASLDLSPRWRGPGLATLLDEAHARIVDRAVTELRSAAWETLVEWSFNHFGERGSADVVAWRAAERALLVGEAKSRLVDLQDLHSGVDRKARIAPALLADERGWRPESIGVVVVLPGEPAIYDTVRRHAATFDSSFPARTVEVRRWIQAPDGPLRGLWFLSPTSLGGGIANRSGHRRCRAVRPRSAGRRATD
jgi:transcriptional regulator with XRE-family HTH domain